MIKLVCYTTCSGINTSVKFVWRYQLQQTLYTRLRNGWSFHIHELEYLQFALYPDLNK